jgi:hypothetical protein
VNISFRRCANRRGPAFPERAAALLILSLGIETTAAGAELEPSLIMDLTQPEAALQWIFYGGSGEIKGDELVLDGTQEPAYAIYKKSEWADTRLEAKFLVEPAKRGVLACGFMVRAKDGMTYYYVHYDRAQAILVRYEPGKAWTEIKRLSKLDKPAGKWHDAAVESIGTKLRVFLNNKLLYEAEHPLLKSGRIGFYASQGRAHIKDIVVKGKATSAEKAFEKPLPFFGPVEKDSGLELIAVRRIWDKARHNAFTDLIRFKDKWYCAFREGDGHVSKNGALRVLVSDDGEAWDTAVHLTSKTADLRDAKLSVSSDGELMLSGAGALHNPKPVRHQSMAWFSKDGSDWTEAVHLGDPNFWLWSVTWHKGTAYGIGYATLGPKTNRLYKSTTGRQFDTLVKTLHDQKYPNETSLVFTDDDTGYCLLRRGGTGMLGVSKPPYTNWEWKDLGIPIGGPKMIQLKDGRFLCTVRLYSPKPHTALAWVDPEVGKLKVVHRLPSGGDTSYAGMVIHDGLLWVSYYSSHQGKTSIYLAKLKILAAK